MPPPRRALVKPSSPRDDPRIRASDADRARTAASLRAAYATGTLSTSTLELRVGAALRARYRWELARLLADLPTERWRRWLTKLRVASAAEDAPRALAVELPLPKPGASPIVLGRSQRCDIVLDDATVSRRHALLSARPGNWRLTDLDSLNGTFIAGKRLTTTAVTIGDVVELGACPVRFGPPLSERD